MIVITDEHLRRYTPAEILGLRGSAQNTLCEQVRDYVPEAFAKLRALMQAAYNEVLKDTPTLSTPKLVREFLRARLEGLDREEFHVLWLTAQNMLIRAETLFVGTLTQTNVYPREIVKRALANNAAACFLAHQHPSGVAEPSRADEFITQEIKRALALVDVKVLDHFIVAPGQQPLSFAEKGLL